jgi:hypothetical protein
VFQILTSSHLSKKLNYIINFSSCFTGLVFVFKHHVALENVVEVELFNFLTLLRGCDTFCNIFNFDCKQGAVRAGKTSFLGLYEL